MILIDATYINSSGGKSLLEYLIVSLCQNDSIKKYLFLFDNRFESDKIKLLIDENIYFTKSSEYSRYIKFKELFSQYSIKSIICFGNVPPPYRFVIHCPVYIYFHNVLLVQPWYNNHNFIAKLILNLKFYYIYLNSKNKYVWIVQSEIVKNKLHSNFKINFDRILVLPFFESINLYFSGEVKKHQYFYPAEGVAQKNHTLLFKVWEELSKFNIRPKLILTIDKYKFPKLHKEISRLNSNNLNIENFGFLSKNDLIYQYNSSKFLIFPSLKESFGLPLVEAANLGCHIIAPDLDYVNNILETNAKFDVEKNNLFDIIYKIETNKFTTTPPTIKVKNRVISLIKLLNNDYV